MSVITPENWDKAGWIFLLAFVTADFVSISVAQMAAAGLGICWLGRWLGSGERPDFSAIKWPVAAFIAASIASASLSLNVRESFIDSKDLTHFFIFFAAYDFLSRHPEKITASIKAAVGAGALAAVYGLGQAAVRGVDIHNRISGFQDIYMTFAGLMMLTATVALSMAIFGESWKKGAWLYAAAALMAVAIAVSLTRNAMVGLFAGALLLLALRSPWAAVAAPVLVAAALAVSPAHIRDRAISIADMGNVTNMERIRLWSAGARIALDHPFFGVGQNSFPLVYPEYRHPDVKEPNISHLHNNVIEIAAERGFTGLAAWIAIWSVALWKAASAWRRARNREIMALAAMGLSTVTAFITAGMFEYNFGAAVPKMMMYFFLAASLAAVKKAEHGPNNT